MEVDGRLGVMKLRKNYEEVYKHEKKMLYQSRLDDSTNRRIDEDGWRQG